jgi:hypothetical protein
MHSAKETRGCARLNAGLDILPSLKTGDSSYETAMPGRENIPGCIDVAIMQRATPGTGPFPYSQTGSTFRTAVADTATARAGLGGVLLVDDHEHYPHPFGFIIELCFQYGPTGVQNGFCHLGFRQPRATDIADDDQGIVFHKPCGELVQSILAPIFDLGVDIFDALLLPGPLRLGQFLFTITVEPAALQLFANTASSGVFQAQVDANLAIADACLFGDFDDNVQIPTTTGILGE